jgi:hypothetical protein
MQVLHCVGVCASSVDACRGEACCALRRAEQALPLLGDGSGIIYSHPSPSIGGEGLLTLIRNPSIWPDGLLREADLGVWVGIALPVWRIYSSSDQFSCFDPLRPNRLERIRGHYGIVLFGSELEVRFDDA